MISQTENSPLFTSQSGSLISRISRGLTSRAKNRLTNSDILSPTSTNFDSISTIKADDFLFDKQEDSWKLQYRNESPQEEKSSTPFLAFGGQTSFSKSHNLQNIDVPSVCFRSATSKYREKHTEPDGLANDPSSRHGQRMRVQGVGAAKVQRGISVSWEISPSKEAPDETSQTEQTNEPANSSSHAPLLLTRRPSSNKDGKDQWREAVDPESGRTYYYNRRTRVSKWRLPTGAVVKKKDSSRGYRQGREQTDCTDNSQVLIPIMSSISQQNPRREESGKKIMHVSLTSDEDKLNISISSSHKEHQASIESCTVNLRSTPNKPSQTQTVQETHSVENEVRLIDPTVIEKPSDIDDMECAGRAVPAHNDEINQLSTTNTLPSPRDDTSHSIFCVYCGCKCESVAMLSSHLPQCTRFTHMQQHGRSTQIDLEIILFRAWSQISYSTDGSSRCDVCSPDQKSSALLQEEKVARTSISQLCNYNGKSNPATLLTPTPRINKDVASTKPYYGIERKKCPFCNDVFDTGNGFSSHLLVCPVRRRVRKQRRTQKYDSPTPPVFDPRSRKHVTPGRRMPWE